MEEKMKFSTFVIGLIITLAILTFYTAFPFSAFFMLLRSYQLQELLS